MRIDQPPTQNPTTTARKAEDTDTRQALHRHDPEFYRKKKDDGEGGGFKDPYEDLTDVSVPALKNFLMGLLDRMPEGDAASHAPSAPVETRAPANPKAAAAMNAYQARSGTPATPPPPPVQTQTPASTSALDQAVAGLDRAAVLDLIRDLDRLAAQGVTSIALEKGDNFLASIRDAITRARDNI